jgi:5-methylcytosine-specific restriction endonuclease McrBC regulatory subunit McrC
MKPDILIRRNGEVIASADCKYKILDESAFKNHDVYQLLAYCTATNTPRGLLIYPLHLSHSRENLQIVNSKTTVRQITIDLGKELNEMVRSCESFADEVFAYSQV